MRRNPTQPVRVHPVNHREQMDRRGGGIVALAVGHLQPDAREGGISELAVSRPAGRGPAPAAGRRCGPGSGAEALAPYLKGTSVAHPQFAPPFLKAGKLVIGQTANILLYLGPRLDLVPKNEPSRLWAHQLQLTIADFIKEAHDTHHPIGSSLYYEDQKEESLRRTKGFVQNRLPRYLAYFERVLQAHRTHHVERRAVRGQPYRCVLGDARFRATTSPPLHHVVGRARPRSHRCLCGRPPACFSVRVGGKATAARIDQHSQTPC